MPSEKIQQSNSKDKDFFLNIEVAPCFQSYCENTFKALLLDRGISQQQLADDLNLNKSYISRIVNGLRVPPLSTRLAISKYLKCDSSQLWRVEHLKEINDLIKKHKKEVSK